MYVCMCKHAYIHKNTDYNSEGIIDNLTQFTLFLIGENSC